MKRDEDDGISVALDPQWEVVFLGGTTLAEVILVKGHELPSIVKVLPGIEQYFLMKDYALWEVMVNGDSPPPKRTIDGVEKIYPPTTAEEKLARKNELKARVQMAMLTMRAKRFLKKTGRKVGANGSETIGFDKTKVEYYNCHKRGYFTREYEAPRENENKEHVRRNVTVAITDANALVAQDGFGQVYDSQVFDNQVFDSQVNDKYKTGKGYHAVPPPYTGNIMPPKPDLILADVDEYVVSESVTCVHAIATNEAKTSESKPKSVSEPIIED
nr:hypothetical protein [Tanacetum cinerariifolium]